MVTEVYTTRATRFIRLASLLMLVLATALLGGCATSSAGVQGLSAAVPAAASPLEGVIQPLSSYQVATPTAEPTAAADKPVEQYATVATQGIRVNLRSGPGTNFGIVVKANPGESFLVIGKSEDGRWYQVGLAEPVAVATATVTATATATSTSATTATTVLTGTTAFSVTIPVTATAAVTNTTVAVAGPTSVQTAWVSAELVQIGGKGEIKIVTTGPPLLPQDLTATWNVDWSCRATPAERCNTAGKTTCKATVGAGVTRPADQQFLPVELTGKWDDPACGANQVWTFEVDRYTGKDRTGDGEKDFLASYWIGQNPGEAAGVFPLDDKRGVLVFCSGPHEQEIPEVDGWVIAQEGYTCHDVKTGMLVYIAYSNKYLFTGTVDGKEYDRAYFGDITKLEQRLGDTNVDLAFVEKR